MAPTEAGHPTAGPEYVSTRELCRRLAISRSTIYRHRLTRYGFQVGPQWRFRWADVVKHYETQQGTGDNGNGRED